MRINTNMSAMIATNQASKNTALSGNSMEKLSTGLRITKAADDAAGLAISEKMRSQIRGMEQADRNVQDGISVVQTAEGATEEVENIVQRMRELSVQAANEVNTAEDRTKITEELTNLREEIDRIADSTKFNGQNLLNGTSVLEEKVVATNITGDAGIKDLAVDEGFKLPASGTSFKLTTKAETSGSAGDQKIEAPTGYTVSVSGSLAADGKLTAGQTVTITDDAGKKMSFNVKDAQSLAGEFTVGNVVDTKVEVKGKALSVQVGANTGASEQLNIKIQNVDTDSLGIGQTEIDAMKSAGTTGTTAAKAMVESLDNALEIINTSRANLGATQNRLEYASSNLITSTENLTSAESRIRDVDVAKEMVELSKLNILSQASQAMISQAKQQPEQVTQLLR